MPTPRKGEKKKDFISRCISHLHEKGEGKSQDQRVAMCHSMAEEHYNKTNESIKSLIEGMTFSSFLVVEAMPEADPSTVKGYIRSLPQYQEMMKDQSAKPVALKLAKQLVDEFGDEPASDRVEDYILDQFDELSSKFYRGTNMGDWKGEEEYQRQRDQEGDIESAARKWEQTTGMDAETGEDMPKKRRMSGARTGMDFGAERKAAQAQSDIASFAQAPASDQADRLATARTQAAGAGAPRTGTKAAQAREIFSEMFGEARPSEIIRRMMEEIGMSKPHATTYYYNMKKKAAQ